MKIVSKRMYFISLFTPHEIFWPIYDCLTMIFLLGNENDIGMCLKMLFGVQLLNYWKYVVINGTIFGRIEILYDFKISESDLRFFEKFLECRIMRSM